jgi:hypothetical protein
MGYEEARIRFVFCGAPYLLNRRLGAHEVVLIMSENRKTLISMPEIEPR